MNDYFGLALLWQQWQNALAQESVAAVGRFATLATLSQRAKQVRKGVTPAETVYEEDRLRLLHYLSLEKPRYKTPLLFIYALVNRPYILDLRPGRSVVAKFVAHGFDTYLLDWGVPTNADRHLTFDDYINGYIANVLDFLRERTGQTQINVLGYCMGGTMSAMFTALHPERVRNLILLAAPIDFATNEGLLNVWTRSESFDVDRFVAAFGNCPPEFLQTTFLLLRPVGNLIEKPLNFYEHMHEEKFIDDFIATENWLNDNIPVPGEIYREFVKYLYQQNFLTRNRMPIGKDIVTLRRITCPVLNIMAEKDDLVPCNQSAPFNNLIGSKDRQMIKLQGSGHIGLAIGGRAQREVWPAATEWLGQRTPTRQRKRSGKARSAVLHKS